MEEDRNEELQIPNHELEEHIEQYFEGDEECALAKRMAESLIYLDKPFGISWDLELVKDFLEKKGYKVIIRLDRVGDPYYSVFNPDREDNDCIPDEQNIMDIFSFEVQKSLLNWLLKIGD